MTTPRLGAPELVSGQAIPETTVNETFYWLDAASLGGFKILDRDLSTPPGSPSQGDAYILSASGSGDWTGGSADDVALYFGTSWELRTPDEGWEAWVADEAVKVAFSSGSWGIIGTFDGADYVSTAGDTMTGDLVVPAEAYGVGWNGSNEVPTKNDVYDKIETITGGTGGGFLPLSGGTLTGDLVVPDEAYDATNWNGSLEAPTKNAIRDKIESLASTNPTESLIVACSDESTALTAGTAKVTFRMPYAFTVTAVRASLVTAQATNGAGGIFTVDINEAGTSILSTKLTIDNTEKTSTTAATAAVISDSSLADDAEMTVDIDQIGDGTAKGLKITLVGHRT